MVTDFLIRIALAGVLGGLIGIERQLRAKEAGLRTHVLVGIGSAMFMIVSKYGFADLLTLTHVSFDPSRVAAQVVSGMGFLGAGTIIIQKQVVKGLTTAAGLWVTAAIGLVIGSGLYEIGIYGAFLTLIVLEMFRQISNRLIGHHHLIEIRLAPQSVPSVLIALQKMRIRPGHIKVNQRDDGDESKCELVMDVVLKPKQSVDKLYEAIMTVQGIKRIDIN
ncbi:MAG: MgtC/SapB family protein [Ewingella americana]|jgi:putative Mg2+ transporter-C (MgtC) family protein|uniref:Protein MgtC n=2 Tax=Ewingella americana TaxID=41202 RepID=A0A085GC50_EWIA3|nr:MgtC/SapB family protein [Ewingella americana]KAA8729808.1 MgtC/SapB family protein [Ewingella americana]KFC81295.1 peptide transport system permease protein [Ewingella americana ATCC 33852]MCI1678432.1 MgtC/SapB family protein [Ewingella americana]MCI1854019.1 MgtC/SapB family protein [Ewingella americana]MCI1861319.1 MgtC/SapB family protein [Ewingella americana]